MSHKYVNFSTILRHVSSASFLPTGYAFHGFLFYYIRDKNLRTLTLPFKDEARTPLFKDTVRTAL